MKKEMHAKHADGPGSGMAVHGSDRSAVPRGAAPVRQPLSHLRVLRASACICVKPWLASPRAARCCGGPRTLRASQDPMHQFARLPPLRRPSEPEADSIDVLPGPYAPIRAASSAGQDSQGPAGIGVRISSRWRKLLPLPLRGGEADIATARPYPDAYGAGRSPCTMSSCPTGAAHRLARSAMRRW
jgi:hypothetical protein